LKGFGIERLSLAVVAAGIALHYLNETEHRNLQHISSISRIEEDRYMWIDRFTVRNLELIGSSNENAVSLVDVLDQTCSPMGARLLRRWMVMPLKELKPIEERLKVVEFLIEESDLREKVLHEIKQIGDLERLISKIGLLKANPREVIQLKRALLANSNIKSLIEKTENEALQLISGQINHCEIIRQKIERSLQPDPPVLIIRGGVIADGLDEELDRLRKIAFGSRDHRYSVFKNCF
jgi:DNA mismatch repair protein MutS